MVSTFMRGGKDAIWEFKRHGKPSQAGLRNFAGRGLSLGGVQARWSHKEDRADVGVEAMEELSRAPKHCPNRTCLETQDALLALKDRYPEWGAGKLTRILQTESGICLPHRTGDEILRRCGRTKKASRAASQPLERFERDACGALLQMDFKGLPHSTPYSILSVLDDHGRYCL